MRRFLSFIFIIVTCSSSVQAKSFFFEDPSFDNQRAEDSLSRTFTCDLPTGDQIRSGSTCPIPPTQKNGRACYAGTIPSFSRHAAGYEDYLKRVVLQATEQTQKFSLIGVSPLLLFSIMAKESFFNPMSYNKWKDMGVAQFQLGTANETLKYMRDIGVEAPESASDKVPPGCRRNPYSTPLSPACFASIVSQCDKPQFSNSLFCPNFAVRLMAFHLLQIQERDVVAHVDGERMSLIPLLIPPEDGEAGLRHILSVYNRGFRIYNSAVQKFWQRNEWPPASWYGPMWSQSRAREQSSDPFAGGTLSGHFINRCYVWAIGGLCGGTRTSIFQQFQERLCPDQPQIPNEKMGQRSQSYFSHGEYDLAFQYLHYEISHSKQITAQQFDRRWRLALSLYEADNSINKDELIDLLKNAQSKKTDSASLKSMIFAYEKALLEVPEDFVAALALLRRLEARSLGGVWHENIERLAQLRWLRAQAWRQWKRDSRLDNLPWVYLAGSAGFRYFGSGGEDLRFYLRHCANDRLKNDRACRFASQAQDLSTREFVGNRLKWEREAE